jgi:ketosteroid isomerase-like protein
MGSEAAATHDRREALDMTPEDARAFAEEWVEAWNAHDLERILGHFTEDITFSSPVAATIVPGSGGVIRGKAALREYWREGLRLIPDLRFEIKGIYLGVGTIVINYRNQKGGLVNEVLSLDGDLVARGYGTYLDENVATTQSALAPSPAPHGGR